MFFAIQSYVTLKTTNSSVIKILQVTEWNNQCKYTKLFPIPFYITLSYKIGVQIFYLILNSKFKYGKKVKFLRQ